MLYTHPGVAFGDILKREFESPKWTEAYVAVAWIRKSGITQLAPSINQFLTNSGKLKIIVGIDLGNTSIEGLEGLIYLATLGKMEVFVYFNEAASVFHPKFYAYANDTHAHLLIGSNNITQSGLYTNCEAAWGIDLARLGADFKAAMTVFNNWADLKSGLCKKLTPALLKKLVKSNYVESEATIQSRNAKISSVGGVKRTPLFALKPPKPAPKVANIIPASLLCPPVTAAKSAAVVAPAPPTILPAALPANAFWFEAGKLTSGSRNQLDLSRVTENGNIPGSISLFGLTGTLAERGTKLTIRYQGIDYSNNTVTYPMTAEGKTNGTWRLQMNGLANNGKKLTSACAAFVGKNIVFNKLKKNHFEIIAVLPGTQLPALIANSSVSDRNRKNSHGVGRSFGVI